MTTEKYSLVDEWWKNFEKDALQALDRLLCRKVFMGEMERNDTDEILFRLFHSKNKRTLHHLDEVMQEWFKKNWRKIPADIPANRWARILKDTFIAVSRLNLELTYTFLADIYVMDKSWLRSIYSDPSRDPEGELLRTLALTQKDTSLLPLWMSLCRLEEDLPYDYAAIGLMGLRKLPEKDGSPQKDLPNALFNGVICLAEALGKYNKNELMEFWLREMRSITSFYPRSKQYWAKYFYPFLHGRNNDLPIQWLDKVIPKLSTHYNTKNNTNKYIQPPPIEKTTYFLNLVKSLPLEKFRSEFEIFVEDHRRYTYQTGDSSFLVNTFSDIGYKLLCHDSTLALELIEEAFTWKPYDPFLWVLLADIEISRGNHSRATALLWEAKRRFHENVKVRNILAHLLEKQGKLNIAEIIYYQAMEDFPNEKVCRNGLVLVLLKQHKKDDAISLLHGTMTLYPSDKHAANLLERITSGKEISEMDELIFKTESPSLIRKNLYDRSYQEDELDFYAPLRTTEFHDLPALDRRTAMAKALERSGVSMISSNVPEEYGKHKYPGSIRPEHNLPVMDFGIAMAKALERSGVSMISSNVPEEYGKHKYPGSIRPESLDLAPELGEIMVELRGNHYIQVDEKENYNHQVATSLARLLEKAPDNLIVLLAKGLWLIDENPDDAQLFLSKLSRSYPNTIGFKLLGLRTKNIKRQSIEHSAWNELIQNFPHRSSLIKLEQVLGVLHHINGNDNKAIEELETLRLRLSKDLGHLPHSLQESEKWLRNVIVSRLFKGINTHHPLSLTMLDTVKENYQKNHLILRDTVDLCLYAAV